MRGLPRSVVLVLQVVEAPLSPAIPGILRIARAQAEDEKVSANAGRRKGSRRLRLFAKWDPGPGTWSAREPACRLKEDLALVSVAT